MARGELAGTPVTPAARLCENLSEKGFAQHPVSGPRSGAFRVGHLTAALLCSASLSLRTFWEIVRVLFDCDRSGEEPLGPGAV